VLKSQQDSHIMIPCTPYKGEPGSDSADAQPFKIQLDNSALVSMDLHAHLLSTEVIGFLAGTWNNESKTLLITSALPCRSVEQTERSIGDRHFNVELDPASEVATRELLEKCGLRIVGWYILFLKRYHSHPTFKPDPSLVDLYNQRNYQNLFRIDSDTLLPSEPFIGAIVSPYDPRLPNSVSEFNWFYVGNGKIDKDRPRQLIYESIPFGSLPSHEIEKMVRNV
jgi:protein MYSM1